jgi:hypothetical protein
MAQTGAIHRPSSTAAWALSLAAQSARGMRATTSKENGAASPETRVTSAVRVALAATLRRSRGMVRKRVASASPCRRRKRLGVRFRCPESASAKLAREADISMTERAQYTAEPKLRRRGAVKERKYVGRVSERSGKQPTSSRIVKRWRWEAAWRAM